jgi:Family of unknown function (DUF6510)
MEALMLDGNAVAGLLQEVFAVETTNAIVTCDTCGEAEAVGATHVYRGAGIIICYPHCNKALMKIVRDDTRLWIGFQGVRMLEVVV